MTLTRLCASCVALLASTGLAHAIVFTDRPTFDAAFPSLPGFQDFEDAGELQRDYADFFLTSRSSGGTGVGTSDSGFPSRVAFQFFADDEININFTIPVEAVGFQIGCMDFFETSIPLSVDITVFDADENIIEMLTIPTTGRQMTTFIGFAGLGEIARVRVADLGTEAGWTAIDDVAYGVPAPPAGTLAGILLVFASRRARR